MIKDITLGVKKIIETIVADKKLINSAGELVNINVFNGFFPANEAGEITPAIAIRVNQGQNSLEERKLNCHIVIQIYSKEASEAYDVLYDLTQEIVDKTLSYGKIGDIAEITPNVKWELIEENIAPFYIMDVNLEIISRKAYRTDVDAWILGE